MAAKKTIKRGARGAEGNVKTDPSGFPHKRMKNRTDKEKADKIKLDGLAPKSITIKKRKGKSSKETRMAKKRGVVYLSHIPHGFYEPQMKEYFAQFGRVRRLVLRRSNKTGKSRGYAFIEFDNDEVAKIVAETMNNYLMFERVLKCKFIPAKEIAKKRLFYSVNINHIKREKLEKKRSFNAPKSEVKISRLMIRKTKKVNKLTRQLADHGINFSFELPENISATASPKPVSKTDVKPATLPEKNSSALPDASSVVTGTDISGGDVTLTTGKKKPRKRSQKNKSMQKKTLNSSDSTVLSTHSDNTGKANGKQTRHRRQRKKKTQTKP